VVHIFLPIKKHQEIDTFSILNYFKHNYPQLQIVIPRTNFETFEMENVLYDHEHTVLVRNKFDIPEPIHGRILSNDQIDLVFVPLLAFDVNGHRVGYGKGFYDQYLAKCSPNLLKIGLSIFDEISVIDDLQSTDIPLDVIITPTGFYRVKVN
jgi:5-formyltetrahydrofolate cyclo-ligase